MRRFKEERWVWKRVEDKDQELKKYEQKAEVRVKMKGEIVE